MPNDAPSGGSRVSPRDTSLMSPLGKGRAGLLAKAFEVASSNGLLAYCNAERRSAAPTARCPPALAAG